ncbi:tRNA (adenosine(37)-N6)-dimethylallyltransferase MiaA [Aquirhabdus parva]|uniref:tRNA dimethylallyltransferase n=1 Tax=Aquirhabdus parva TaxID=2283318 RepID=A0A345P531_9GAMM|nr:tRNA (adenosine(37)-N6)-dimethylallyltransferase MiaA [Aquirhabdus parva]AXI02390.1 tRNA (adenosine(37)-N6)-dimethylallyltransferase MiaA [Aquirhabdus parva]
MSTSDSRYPPTVCLMGPTASGKTALACELYDTGRYEIISVDSALVYRGLDIGTAKPTKQELQLYPHHLIDMIEPEDVYSAASFVEDAKRLIGEIQQRGKTPLLVGGTMLYFRSLLSGMAEMPAADQDVRAEIVRQAELHGWDWIHQQLALVDPRAAQRFLPSDRQRVMRALEVFRISGRAISDFHDTQETQPMTDQYTIYALVPDRALLHERIALRLEQMWAAGFMDEVRELRKRPNLHAELPSMRAVGYRQVWEYLDQIEAEGINDRKDAKSTEYQLTPHSNKKILDMQDRALFATRQLAKRQYTWIRSLRESHTIQIFNTVNEGFLHLRS